MISRKDLWAVGLALLIAAVVALAVYVVIDLAEPEPVVVVTAPPLQPPSATPTVAVSKTAPATATSPPEPLPQFGQITFGTGMSGDQVLGPGATFAVGTKEVYAVWDYQNMTDGVAFQVSWLLDDSPWSYESLAWDADRYGSQGQAYVAQISEHDADGLPPGNYRLELSIGERLSQLATFVILGPTPTRPPPTATSQPDTQELGRNAARSLVELLVPYEYGGYGGGSGSIVDGSQGLILTNWHVVADSRTEEFYNEGGYAQVWLTTDPDRSPEFTYWAQVVRDYADIDYDLAILRITHLKDGRTLVQEPLDLPAISIGDSDLIRRGDDVLLLGYPDYARGTLSWTEGIVATRDDEERWIKSDAGISHGHSGGMMLNQRGELIGVPTQYEETSVGGVLALARPVNLATGLIQNAIARLQPLPSAPLEVEEPTGERMVVLAAPTLNLRDGPSLQSNVVGDLPLGTAVQALGAPEWDGERFWYRVQVPDGGPVGWASEVYLASWETARTPLLFTSNRAGSLDIYSIYPDGTGLTQLTNDPGDEGDASWSPDRDHIVFTYAKNDDSDLYLMRADGSSWTQLTSGPADDAHPVWSPDSTRIAFASNQDGDWEICVLDLTTREKRQLTFNGVWDSFPDWSPDGAWLVFASRRTGNYDLFIVDADTGEELQLTYSPYSDAHPAWSPYGDEIVYTMVVAEGNSLLREIGVLNLYDPVHPRRLTESAKTQALHRYPAWSPDGRWVVFESERDGNEEVYIIPAQGGIMANLTNAPESGDSAPAWSR